QYNWWNEALHGVGRAGIATVFPQAIGLASTWNRELIKQVARAISDEGRAKHHDAVRKGIYDAYFGLTFWSPNINIFRDPRWGRGQETYGECPYLTGQIGLQFVRGLQGDHPTYLKTVATPKHFAVHSGPEKGRHSFDAQVSLRDLHETYLPAFKTCIVEGKAASIMGAYNRVNGQPCCASPLLLQQILREEWGFDGVVVSDCGALYDIYANHGVTDSAETAATLALTTGCDLDCCGTYNIPCTFHSLSTGRGVDDEIDRAVTRLFTARFKLGMFDPPAVVPFAQIPISVVNSAEHRALAQTAAEQSLILLKNENGLLPLDPTISQKIAVIGPNAAEPLVLSANYAGDAVDAVSVLAGLQRVDSSAEISYARGCELWGEDQSQFAEAVAVVDAADVAIVVLGLSQQLEGEEEQSEGNPPNAASLGDRVDLALPTIQQALLQAVHATGTPLVLVLINGSALAVNWADAHVPAILEAWYAGQAGGTAIANAIFGYVNPAGRLPVTVYRSVDDLPPFDDYAMRERTYRFFTGQPLYKFGFGLSYTVFEYGAI
ncbi:MAG TPA: glycoside hydrolase family 3 protein, partial [Anaerolineae bacterium]|nr:glycoside hydrolase family 3 protein [Anaerolineae bacterium]